jgi:hypothetical protein
VNQSLNFVRWTALGVFFGMLIAKYGFDQDQLRFWTIIPAAICIAAGVVLKKQKNGAETNL